MQNDLNQSTEDMKSTKSGDDLSRIDWKKSYLAMGIKGSEADCAEFDKEDLLILNRLLTRQIPTINEHGFVEMIGPIANKSPMLRLLAKWAAAAAEQAP
jgi:hypothetical protein